MNERSCDIVNRYACRVFNDDAMRRYLPGDTYKQLKKIIDQGRPMQDPALADIVANGLKRWIRARPILPIGSSPSPAPRRKSMKALFILSRMAPS